MVVLSVCDDDKSPAQWGERKPSAHVRKRWIRLAGSHFTRHHAAAARSHWSVGWLARRSRAARSLFMTRIKCEGYKRCTNSNNAHILCGPNGGDLSYYRASWLNLFSSGFLFVMSLLCFVPRSIDIYKPQWCTQIIVLRLCRLASRCDIYGCYCCWLLRQ